MNEAERFRAVPETIGVSSRCSLCSARGYEHAGGLREASPSGGTLAYARADGSGFAVVTTFITPPYVGSTDARKRTHDERDVRRFSLEHRRREGAPGRSGGREGERGEQATGKDVDAPSVVGFGG